MPELLAAASRELADAAVWYESHQRGLGVRSLVEVRQGFDQIDKMPLAGAPWIHRMIPERTRRALFLTFPYSISYVTEPRVVVVAIAHASRDPTYWIDRLEPR